MVIRQLSIKHFRGIHELTLPLGEHRLLLGPNNVGKTTVLAALNLLLGRERMRPSLIEYDFCDKEFQPDGDGECPRIEIRAILTGFDNGADKGPENRAFFRAEAGRVLTWDALKREVVTTEPDGKHLLKGTELAFFARYAPDLGEFESVRVFPNPNEDPFSEVQSAVRDEHLRMIGFFYLPTARLWENALRLTGTTFRKLLSEFDARPGTVLCKISEQLEKLKPKAESDKDLEQLLAGLTEVMEQFIPLGGDSTETGFEVTRLHMDDVERSLTLFLRSDPNGPRLPMSCQGSGLVSLQILAMLLKFGAYRRDRQQSFILAVEEPELHLYPHLQRQFVAEVRKRTTQSVFTTHSPYLTERFSPDEIMLLRKDAGGKLATTPLLSSPPNKDSKNRVKDLFFRQRRQIAESLMGRLCVVAEGYTESYVIPRLSELCEEPAPAELLGVSVVDGAGTELVKNAEALACAVPHLVILLDGDDAGDALRSQALTSTKLSSATVLQMPAGWGFEAVMVTGLSAHVTDAARQRIEGSVYAKANSYCSLLEALVDNKGCTPILDIYLESIAEGKVPPVFRRLHQAIAVLAFGKPLAGLTGITKEGDGAWRIQS